MYTLSNQFIKGRVIAVLVFFAVVAGAYWLLRQAKNPIAVPQLQVALNDTVTTEDEQDPEIIVINELPESDEEEKVTSESI